MNIRSPRALLNLSLILLVIAVLVGACSPAGAASGRWDYRIVEYALYRDGSGGPAQIVDLRFDGVATAFSGTEYALFDQLGADGWALVGQARSGGLVFNRPLS